MSKTCNSIAPLASNFSFGRSNLDQIDREWRMLRNYDFSNFFDADAKPMHEFWIKISKLRLGDSEPFCKNLCAFVVSILSLPHSSATVERIFSQINLNKTKIRNKLSTETLSGIMHTKKLLKSSISCFNFEIKPEMFTKYKSETLYSDNK